MKKKSAMIATLSTSLLAGTPSVGVSQEALYIDRALGKSWEPLQASTVLGHSDLSRELDLLAEECAADNWDGYGAIPVVLESIAQAHEFLRVLPLGMTRPTIGVEPDGQVTFEWYASPRRTLSVSVSPEGELHYAALLGPSRQYGSEPLLGEIPAAILELIRRIGRS